MKALPYSVTFADNFNVPSLTSDENFYQRYSVQGQHSKRSYIYNHKYGSDSIAFIAVDACLLPGPRRPFNFIGEYAFSCLIAPFNRY